MKEFFHSVKFKILICLGALLLGLMAYAAVTLGTETPPEQIVGTLLYPFTSAANAVADGVSGFIDTMVNANSYKAENEELKAQLTELYKKTKDYDTIANENDQLREMLGLKEKNPDFIFSESCNVTSRVPNDIYGGFTVGSGKSSGLSLYDPVVTSVGLAGRVTSIAEYYARVETIISPNVNVGVYSIRSRVTGVIENTIESAQDGMCIMGGILKDADIAVGDVVFTSGKSGLYPDDLMVGTVVEIIDDANGLSKHAVVKPAVDVFSVTSVFVITDFDGKGVPFEIEE
ncbi:MAG: rod shape-determining protein MreC [Oscillospiraceae bacterium]|nr:rod shape-determining protein MreC [Oscillospiraceae bacterium]